MAKRKKRSDYYEHDELKIDKDLAVNQVIKDFEWDANARSDRETRIWRQADSLYYGRLKPKTEPWPGCSNFAHPMPRIICDTMTDNLSHSFPSQIDLIKPVPVSNDDHTKASKRGQLLNYQWKTEIKWDEVKQDLFHIAVRYGDCFTKQYYDVRKRQKTDKEIEQEIADLDMSQLPEGTNPADLIDPEVTLFHGVQMDVINIEDIYKPADSIGVQKDTCAHIIHHVRMARAEYDEKVYTAGYTKIDFSQKKTDQAPDAVSGESNDERRKSQIGINKRLKDTEYYIHLLEWHGGFYNESSKRWQEVVILIHPQSMTVCKACVNPLSCRPFVQHSPRSNVNQPYHEGYPEIVKQIAHYLNTIYNQRRDSESKRVAMPGFYDKGSEFKPKNYLMKPNSMYPTSGPPSQSVYFPNYQGAPPEMFNEEEILKRMVIELTGVSDPIKAATSPGDKTATEIRQVVNRFNIRFDSVFSRFERSLTEVTEQMSELDRLYMPEDKEYRVLGHNGKYSYESISSSDMSDKFDIIFKGNSVSNELLDQQKAMQTYQIGVGNPLVATNPVYLYNHLKRLYEALHVDRIDELVPVPVQALTRTPQEEHEMMYKGVQVPVQLNENAEEHWAQHQQEMDTIGWHEKVDPFIRALFLQHQNSTNALKAAQMTAKMSGTQSTVGPAEINPQNTAPAAPVGGAPAKPVQKNNPKK